MTIHFVDVSENDVSSVSINLDSPPPGTYQWIPIAELWSIFFALFHIYLLQKHIIDPCGRIPLATEFISTLHCKAASNTACRLIRRSFSALPKAMEEKSLNLTERTWQWLNASWHVLSEIFVTHHMRKVSTNPTVSFCAHRRLWADLVFTILKAGHLPYTLGPRPREKILQWNRIKVLKFNIEMIFQTGLIK